MLGLVSPTPGRAKALGPAPLPSGPRPWFKFPAPSGGSRPLPAGHQLPSSAGTAEPLSGAEVVSMPRLGVFGLACRRAVTWRTVPTDSDSDGPPRIPALVVQ